MYRIIKTDTWTDSKVRDLPPNEKLLFIYLITNSHAHVSGIYYIPEIIIAKESGLPINIVRKCIDILCQNQLIAWDAVNEIVWVIKMLVHQKASGGKIVQCIASHLNDLHNSKLINDFLEFYKDYNIPYPIPHRRGMAYPMVYPPVPVPVPELINSKEKKTENIPFEEIIQDLNALIKGQYRSTSESTRRSIRARWADGFTLDDFKTVHRKKVAEWLNDAKMCKFLRPETLYGNKFEGYLNQPEIKEASPYADSPHL